MTKPATAVARQSGGNRPAKHYFPEGFYSMQADKAMEEVACETSLPTPMRLYFLCVARANVWGHAPFEGREIGKLLGIGDSTRHEAIRTLKSAKLIADNSNSLCIVLSAFNTRRKDRSYKMCSVHGELANRLWLPRFEPEWEPQEGYWDELLNSDGGPDYIVSVREKVKKTRIIETEERETELTFSGNRELRPETIAALAARAEKESLSRCIREGCEGWDNGNGYCWDHQLEEEQREADERNARHVGFAKAGGGTMRSLTDAGSY